MRDPARDHVAERGEPAPAGGQIERHVEQVAALPVALRIVVVEHVDLAGGRQPEHGDQRRHRLRVRARDRLLVGGDQRALVHGQPLRPEEQLRRAQHEGVLAAVEHVAQDHVHELVDEQRRRVARRRGARDRDRRPPRSCDRRDDRGTPIITVQFSRASASAIAAISRGATGRRGSASSAACKVRSTTQASGGGASSGRAR